MSLRTENDTGLDRARVVSFSFDGKAYRGFAGDTLASALLAQGIHLVGRSFKYHRPRGIVSSGSEEPNALVTLHPGTARMTPNLRATQVEIVDGLVATSQNRWPSLRIDVGAINALAAPMLTAGFYYKTFMGPFGATRAWKFYEPLIRRAAGLGAPPVLPDADRYTQRYAHCDVLVVGAGVAGLAAARAAAASGARVILCDERTQPGGARLFAEGETIDGVTPSVWAARCWHDLSRMANVRLLPRTQAFSFHADNFVALNERVTDHLDHPDARLPRERLWQVRAKRVVLATGAIERPLVFPDNDRPGIMLAGAAQDYLQRYGVRCGTKAVVFTACDTAYDAAFALRAGGVAIAAIVDLRADPPAVLTQRAKAAGIDVIAGVTIVATRGGQRVSGVTVAGVNASAGDGGRRHLACDLLLMSGGWTPSVHLHSQARGKLAWRDALHAFVPDGDARGRRSVGSCNGTFELAAALDEAQAGEGDAPHLQATSATRDVRGMIGACPHDRDPRKVKAFVDFQNDVTAKDIALAVQEGFRSIEHVKRYTTSGMATDQGKTSNLNALAIAADASRAAPPSLGLTTFRAPFTPVTFGALAGLNRGALFDPAQRTPIDAWARAQGAVFENVGSWQRVRYFRHPGETTMHEATLRECATVRESVGMFDASTLGKIEVVGPDACAFLERIYVNALRSLKVGACRYVVLLNEAGFIIDDGIVARLATDRFHVTTTTGGAPRVLNMMEDYLQTEWPEMNVWLTSITEQWAVIAVQGPKARESLAPLIEGIDLAAQAMPHMSVREGSICGVPTRLFRVSFTGETGYEINVPADYGAAVWQGVHQSVTACGGCAYGTETMHILRAEKGYIIVGQETDGTLTPDDAGLGWAIGKAKPDFVGKRSLARADVGRAPRKQIVGLFTADPTLVLEEGAQIVASTAPTAPLGHVTSAYFSAALGRSIALAALSEGRARIGESLLVPMPHGHIEVAVTAPVFLDPKGERLHG